MSEAPRSTDFGKTSSGMQPNVSALLAYVFGLITGVIFLLLEKDNRFVKFHAVQSIVFSIALAIVSFAAGFTPLLGPIAVGVVQLAGLVVWILLMVKAYQGKWYRLPVVGDIAAKQSSLSP